MNFLKWLWRLVEGFLPHNGERAGKMLWVLGLFLFFSFGASLIPSCDKKESNYKGANIGQIINSPDIKRDVAYVGCGLWRGEVRVRIQPK